MLIFCAQAVSGAIAESTLRKLESGQDTGSQWRRYEAAPKGMDILFVGDSRVRADVDIDAIDRQLSAKSGRSVHGAKLGISSAVPALLDAILYQVAHRSPRPREIVLAVSEYQFNENFNPDPTADFWQITSFDPGYLSIALRLDPNRGRLARGWLVPVFANSPVIVQGVQCLIQNFEGTQLCSQVSRFPEDHLMTADDEHYILGVYRDVDLYRYGFSNTKLSYLRDGIASVRRAGVRVQLVTLPVYKIDAIDPEAYAQFQKQIADLAATAGIDYTDLHNAMQLRPEMWGDPSHLNHRGARELANQLAMLAT